MEIKINSLAEAIKFKRCLMGLSQRQLANRLGVDYTYLSKLENDKRIPSIKLLKSLETVLEFEEGELIAVCGIASIELQELIEEAVRVKGDEAVIAHIKKLLK